MDLERVELDVRLIKTWSAGIVGHLEQYRLEKLLELVREGLIEVKYFDFDRGPVIIATESGKEFLNYLKAKEKNNVQ